MIRHVLVCVDGSIHSEACVEPAVAVGRSQRARLTLLHVVEPSHGDAPTDPLDWEVRCEEARHYLARLEASIGKAGIAVETQIVHGRPADRILREAAKPSVDLIALSSHGEGGLTDWRLSSTAQKVVARAPASVLLVPCTRRPKRQDMSIREVMVPLDGSMRAEGILPIAARIAAAHDAEVVLVHVVPQPCLAASLFPSMDDGEMAERLAADNELGASSYLARLKGRLRAGGVRANGHIVRGTDVGRTLMDYADSVGVDLVVLSAHGQGASPSRTYGSVSERLVSLSDVPLLIIQDLSHRREDGQQESGADLPAPPPRLGRSD